MEDLTPGQIAATLAYESATLAQTKRPLSQGGSEENAPDSAKRAKTTPTAPTGEAADEPITTNAPLPDENKPARDLLKLLKTMDCRSPADLLRLRALVTGARPFELPLLTETAGNSRFHYVLKIGGTLSTPVAADPKDCPDQPEQDREEVEKLGVLELAVDERVAAAKTPTEDDGAGKPPPLPAYLMPLGEVYAANRGAAKPQEVCSTNFFVLMDITSPRKSLWMIYRYQRPVERAGGVRWENVNALGREAFFRSGGGQRPFDTVCLLTGVWEWESPLVDLVRGGMECFGNGSVGGGRRRLEPVFTVPGLKGMREVVEKGWERPTAGGGGRG